LHRGKRFRKGKSNQSQIQNIGDRRKRMLFKKGVVSASITVIAALTIISMMPRFSARAQSTNSLGTDPIVGSWHVAVSFDDGRPNVLALYTFDRDRNFIMDGSWPGLFGPGNGSWNRNPDSSDSSVDLTFFRLLYSPSETNETTGALNATFNGTLKVQARLTVNGDGQTFGGRYSLTNFDPTGKVRSTVSGNLNATRIVVEPLP
jgi:hypothetical protein